MYAPAMPSRTRPRLRYIPFRKKDIVEMCISTNKLSGADQIQFRDFCMLLQSVFHFEFHEHLEQLKDIYAPLNPDRDTRKIGVFLEENVSFGEALHELLNKANYEKLGQEALEQALEESSLFKLKLKVDFDDFEEVLLYTRGESQHEEMTSALFGLIKKPIVFANFDRVVVYIRYREGLMPDAAKGKPGSTMLKLFQNVPRADVEMLFPNTRLGMRTIDKLMIGIPALVGAGAIFTTQVGTSLLLLGTLLGFWLGLHSEAVELDEARMVAILAGLGGLGSYFWKQFSNFRNRKLLFMQSLTQNLYFKNLDNNAGVFHRLIDDAEEEECKEAILAYFFLLTAAEPMGVQALDEGIEGWFRQSWQAEVDFEIHDAVDKLKGLGLVVQEGEHLSVRDLTQASALLDKRWDEYFSYNTTGGSNA
jgi:hypothetical protein